MLKIVLVHKSLIIITVFLAYLLSFIPTAIADASKGHMLQKVYKLDAVISSGHCPVDLKKFLHASNEDFGCDRVRIDYGYRSNEFVQCKSRKDLANRIIGEYNVFIDQCESEKQ